MAKTKSISPKKSESQNSDETPRGRFARYCFVLVLLGGLALVWMSLLTYSPTDWPARQASDAAAGPANAAGAVGVTISHTLLYWLGSGSYVGVAFLTLAVGVLLFSGRLSDLPWRLAGVALLIAAVSTGLYLHKADGMASVRAGRAGVMGAWCGEFLLSRLAGYGGWLVVSVAVAMGAMLSADFLVTRLPAVGRAMLRAGRWVGGAIVGAIVGTGRGLFRRRKRPAAAEAPAARAPAARTIVPPGATGSYGKLRQATAKPTPAKNAALPVRRPTARRVIPVAAPGAADVPLPSVELLADPTTGYIESQQAVAAQKRLVLQETLDNFNVDAQMVGHQTGPVITLFELALAPGVKVSQVAGLDTDIARALAVPGVRVVPHLPGRDTIGIEVPNMDKEIVRLKTLMLAAPELATRMHLPLYLGKDAGGDPIVCDLASMPHMLIAGTTGSGKSVCINSIIMSLLLTRRPEEVGFILVDPKMVEMAAFEDIRHLLCPIVTDTRKAEGILEWAATKMDERYALLKEAGVRNIASYNALSEQELYERLGAESDEEKARTPKHLKYFVIIVDELADLIMTGTKESEGHIIRIAQKARAVGIHMILATQRPSANVVTGLIKANMPCRVSFRVASRQESRIVLDQNGAEVLMGQGDMLLLQPGASNLMRAQGTYVDDAELRAVTKALRGSGKPVYNNELVALTSGPTGEQGGQKDEMFDKAVEAVLTAKRGSVSLLQRRLQIGYGRASRIIDQMAESGLLGDYKGSQARECLITLDDWREMQQSIAADQSGRSAFDGEPTSV